MQGLNKRVWQAPCLLQLSAHGHYGRHRALTGLASNRNPALAAAYAYSTAVQPPVRAGQQLSCPDAHQPRDYDICQKLQSPARLMAVSLPESAAGRGQPRSKAQWQAHGTDVTPAPLVQASRMVLGAMQQWVIKVNH